MKRTFLFGGRVYTGRSFKDRSILIEGRTLSLLPADTPPSDGADIAAIDARGLNIVPGFIDVHTPGAAGVDVNHADAGDYEKLCRFFAARGTTAWLCSILTDTREQTNRCIDQFLLHQKQHANGSRLLGIHLEGPFLSPAYKGAMPEHLLQTADLSLLRAYQERARGNIRYITVSPEVAGVTEQIPRMRELGIQVAIGHSGADYQTAMEAIQNGACAATHTFNAMQALDRHAPGILCAVLESDIYCEAICDGLHLHPGIVRLLLKAKGIDRVIAITDSIMAAGLPDGNYRLGVNDVTVKNKDARLTKGGARAGSTLTQDAALRNLLEFTGRPLEEILPLLTENPAKLIGVFDRKGSIADGKDADLVLLNEKNQIVSVYAEGRLQTAQPF